MKSDDDIVRSQLGREPRGRWRTVKRCPPGAPVVIATASELDDHEPFPTLYWLTCPVLREHVSKLESSGETDAWCRRLASDPQLAARMLAADEVYRRLRQSESSQSDHCLTVGIAGQRDPLKTKCLHAHVAAYLAGVADPIGETVMATYEWKCDGHCLVEEDS